MAAEILNHDTICMLQAILEDEFTLLVDTFLDDASTRIAEMAQALTNNERELELAAHTLKGSSANIGAVALSASCAVVVTQCRHVEQQAVMGDIVHIQQQLNALAPKIRRYVKLLELARS